LIQEFIGVGIWGAIFALSDWRVTVGLSSMGGGVWRLIYTSQKISEI